LKNKEMKKELLLNGRAAARQQTKGPGKSESERNLFVEESCKDDKPQILIVDDDPLIRELLAEMLGNYGYRVQSVSSGQMALSLLADEEPELILLDVKMPDMDGYEVCSCIKSNEKNRMTPVIFISALDYATDKVKGFKSGGVDYITKPFQLAEVLIRIETHISLRRLQKQLEAQNLQLQKEIAERRQVEDALEIKSQGLEEANTALSVMLKRREEDKIELEQRLLSNVNELVIPYLEKMKGGRLDAKGLTYLSVIEMNLKDLLSPFLHTMISRGLNLTPKEIEVINLIKAGKSTKEIAIVLSISKKAVDYHRDNIRKKLNLKDRKTNLKSYLLSYQ
jgi:DNA-binding response OmpR family regulator/DNA-binding CsgD family transcriptional regulator